MPNGSLVEQEDPFYMRIELYLLTLLIKSSRQLNKLDNVQEMINSGCAVPVKDNVEYAISRVDDLVNWSRKGSLWPSKSFISVGTVEPGPGL